MSSQVLNVPGAVLGGSWEILGGVLGGLLGRLGGVLGSDSGVILGHFGCSCRRHKASWKYLAFFHVDCTL